MEISQARIITIIADQLGKSVNEISVDSGVMRDLGADSLDVVELVMEFEQAFNVEISDSQLETITTVNDMIVLLNEFK